MTSYYVLRLLLTSLISITLGCAVTSGHKSVSHPLSHTSLIVAHRGVPYRSPFSSQKRKDNSLYSLRLLSSQDSIGYAEIDVRLSKEKAPYLFHDKIMSSNNIFPSLSPVSVPISKGLKEMSNASIESYPISLNPLEYPPQLSAALAQACEKGTILFLDLKGEQPLHVPILFDLKDLVTQCAIVQIDSIDTAKEVRSRIPSVKILARAHSPREAEVYSSLHPYIIQGNKEWMTESLIKTLHLHGMRVLVKTLAPFEDTPLTWRALAARGVDFILTDHGSIAQETLQSYPQCSRAGRPALTEGIS
jgi:glycerophosphoryl diester phosphodiesterase